MIDDGMVRRPGGSDGKELGMENGCVEGEVIGTLLGFTGR